MQASPRFDAVALARGRARRWLRVFLQLVRVLDRLDQKNDSLLASSIVFLVQRALGRLENSEPVAPIARQDQHEMEECELGGNELVAALSLSRGPRDRRGTREDPSTDELEVLLVLAGALTGAPDEGAFGDFSIPAEQLEHEYRALKHSSGDAIASTLLLPAVFRERWAGLLQDAARRGDPMRRLSLEVSVMKVIHALYAMAIGYRRAAEYDSTQPDNDAWLAYSIGETTLKGARLRV